MPTRHPDPLLDQPTLLRRAHIGVDVALAARHLEAGDLVAIPTETVYGLGADAANPQAVAAIFAAKGRPNTHPLIVHIAHADQLSRWAIDIPDIAMQIAQQWWPGPLTMILQKHPDVDSAVTGGQQTIGVRVPAHSVALQLLSKFRNGTGGIAAPSANRFGALSPTSAAHVRQELGNNISYILDGGPCQIGVESTIIDLSGVTKGRPITLLRPGGVTRQQLQTLVGEISAPDEHSPTVSGSLASHYAPRARVIAATMHDLHSIVTQLGTAQRTAVIAPQAWIQNPPAVAGVAWHPLSDDIAMAAQQLYRVMRDIDQAGFELIIAALPPAIGLGEAIADRLSRAAGPRDNQQPSGNHDQKDIDQ